MNMSINFPHLGIYLEHVGKTIEVFGIDIAYYGIVIAVSMIAGVSLILAEALQKLPDIQREAVLLHHFYGYKNREIAHMTGASHAAVKSRIRQGLAKLHQLLSKEDFYGES